MLRLCLGICFLIVHMGFSVAGEKIPPLVDTQWLKQNLKSEKQVILDVRPAKSFAKGHVPSAISAPYNVGWRKKIGGVIGMLPPENEIVAHIRSLGVDNDEQVILLPHGNSSTDFGAATRIYWTFKVLGHDKVSILNGGYKAWFVGGGKLAVDATTVQAGEFTANFRPELLADESQVKATLGTNTSLVDARPVSQFEGKSKSPVVKRAGTIPNSINLQQSKLYDAKNASFASTSKLQNLSKAIGVDDQEMSIAFCNTGHWASIAWFALSEIQGKANVSLYDGSMAEWTTNKDNPVLKAE